MIAASLILAVSAMTATSCEYVFLQSAINFRARLKIYQTSGAEKKMLTAFAHASCKTTNPDILWKMAATESSLRPLIALNNRTHQIMEGSEVERLVIRSSRNEDFVNVDVGLLQINMKAHGATMAGLGLSPLNPTDQVRYLVDTMMPALIKRCGKDGWVGCYHSWSVPWRSKAYQIRVASKEKALRRALSELSPSKKKILTEVRVEPRSPRLEPMFAVETTAYQKKKNAQ